MRDLDYFRKPIREAMGAWIADRLRDGAPMSESAGLRMQLVQVHLLSMVDYLELAGEEYQRTQGEQHEIQPEIPR